MDEPDALQRFLDYLRDGVIVGHHIGHDVGTFDAAFERHWGFHMSNRSLDTMDLTLHLEKDGAFSGRPPIRHFTLDALCEMFGVIPHGRHTASGDAFITAQVFLRLLRLASDGRETSGGCASRLPSPPDATRRPWNCLASRCVRRTEAVRSIPRNPSESRQTFWSSTNILKSTSSDMERRHILTAPSRPLVLLVDGRADTLALYALSLSAMGFDVVPREGRRGSLSPRLGNAPRHHRHRTSDAERRRPAVSSRFETEPSHTRHSGRGAER